MSGIGDKIRGAIMGAVPGANQISKALGGNDGHTTSGIDSAMQAHANKEHPVGNGITRRKDGSLRFPLDGD